MGCNRVSFYKVGPVGKKSGKHCFISLTLQHLVFKVKPACLCESYILLVKQLKYELESKVSCINNSKQFTAIKNYVAVDIL